MSEEELELLDYTFDLAIGECYSDEINEISKLKEKIIRLQNIIKEVREYVNNIMYETKREEKIQDDILEILDKENK